MKSSAVAPRTFPIYARYPELEGALPRLTLGNGPSPLVPLDHLSARLGGPPLWVKNDGLYGGLYGGNKVRKLEFVLADAVRRRSRTIITFGAIGTNHGLATALYAGQLGLRTVLILVDQPVDDHVRAQVWRLHRAGAILHRSGTVVRTALLAPLLAARYFDWRRGRPPYLLPMGGSSPLGAVGYVNAAFELADQVAAGDLPEPARIFVALGSGGTAAGLLLGLRLAGLRSRLVAVRVSDVVPLLPKTVTRLADRTAALLRRRGAQLPRADLRPEDVTVLSDWLGGGYGHPTAEAQRAQDAMRETEGLQLEGVYTAKTVAALIDLVQEGRLAEGPVLYWHTFNALPLPSGPLEDADPSRLPRAFRSLVAPKTAAGRVQPQR